MHPIKDPRLWALGGVGLLIYLQTEHGLFGGGSFYGKAEHEEDEDHDHEAQKPKALNLNDLK